jgi:hypothetical protein
VVHIQKESLSELAGVLPVKKEFRGVEAEERLTRKRVAEKIGAFLASQAASSGVSTIFTLDKKHFSRLTNKAKFPK